jgi:hypothetical protein
MGLKLFVGALFAVLIPGLAEAADCVTVRPGDVTVGQGDIAIVKDAGCGDLKLMSRSRDDNRPNMDIGATWIEFAAPAGPAEWRYNDWIKRQVATINFDKPINLAPELRREDRFAINSLYRSGRLISARYARCCGGKGETIYQSVNVDIARWTLFSPDDFVSLGAAANACWRRFADEEKRGEAFARTWPFERPWADRDFESRRIGPAMREMIGPAHPARFHRGAQGPGTLVVQRRGRDGRFRRAARLHHRSILLSVTQSRPAGDCPRGRCHPALITFPEWAGTRRPRSIRPTCENADGRASSWSP